MPSLCVMLRFVLEETPMKIMTLHNEVLTFMQVFSLGGEGRQSYKSRFGGSLAYRDRQIR